MNKIQEIQRINDEELYSGSKRSWHDDYDSSPYVYVGGLSYELTEGDVIAFMSQYGEPADINLVRDKGTGKSKGFCFLAYEDQRSTRLAVDNLNGTVLCGRKINVDHVKDYKPPETDSEDEGKPKFKFAMMGAEEDNSEDDYLLPQSTGFVDDRPTKKRKKDKKEKKSKKEKKEKKSKSEKITVNDDKEASARDLASSSRDYGRSSNHHHDLDRDRNRDVDRDRSRHRGSDRERDRGRDRDHNRDRDRNRDKEWDREKGRHGDRSRHRDYDRR